MSKCVVFFCAAREGSTAHVYRLLCVCIHVRCGCINCYVSARRERQLIMVTSYRQLVSLCVYEAGNVLTSICTVESYHAKDT